MESIRAARRSRRSASSRPGNLAISSTEKIARTLPRLGFISVVATVQAPAAVASLRSCWAPLGPVLVTGNDATPVGTDRMVIPTRLAAAWANRRSSQDP